jgi:hypothetical protein
MAISDKGHAREIGQSARYGSKGEMAVSVRWTKIALRLGVFMILVPAFGQIVVKNGPWPKNPNAGRTVLLEEVLRIREDGDKIVFKNPRRPALGLDESIFVLDEANLYRFGKDGRFLFQYAKSGQGPGEAQYFDQFLVEPGKIRILSWTPPKIMDFDLRGKLLRDSRTRIQGPFWYMARLDGKIYGIRDEIRHSDAIFKTGLIGTPYTIYEISDDFQNARKIADIPILHYIENRRWVRRVMMAFAGQGPYLYVIHTAEYRVEKMDLRTGHIERVFEREYPRKKLPPEEGKEKYREAGQGVLSPPAMGYAFDIYCPIAFKDSLWVVTFTEKDGGQSRLIDVFDPEGRYLDSFFLRFPPVQKRHDFYWSLITEDGFLFLPEEDEDGLYSIGKYRIPGFTALAVPLSK